MQNTDVQNCAWDVQALNFGGVARENFMSGHRVDPR